jgi:hypothetical protein
MCDCGGCFYIVRDPAAMLTKPHAAADQNGMHACMGSCQGTGLCWNDASSL